MLRTPLTAYVALVVLAAAAAVITLPPADLGSAMPMILGLAALAAVVGSRSVRVPGLGVRITASDLFVFVALASDTPTAAPLIALAGVVGAAMGPLRDPSLLRLLFNSAAVPLAIAVAARIVLALGNGGQTALLPRIGAVLAGTAAYVVLNVVLVAVAVALEGKRGFFSMIGSTTPVAAAAGATCALAGFGLLALVQAMGAPALVVGLAAVPPLTAQFHAMRHREGSAS